MEPQFRSALAPRAARWILILAGMTAALSAAANPSPPDAPSTSDGDYTVTAHGCGALNSGMFCAGEWLEERIEPNSGWQSVSGTFVDKPPGIYSYRSADVVCDAWYSWCYTRYSAAVSVTVTGGIQVPPEPLEAQLGYRYTVRAGNVVGDWRTDLLIERVTGPSDGRGVIDTVMLQQVGSGTFQAVVPSSAQQNTSLWQPANATVTVEDMNADGYADIAVRNVSAVVSGADDQIVFASGNPGDATPLAVRSFDASLRQFTQDVTRYAVNNYHFAAQAPLLISAFVYRYSYCPDSYGIDEYSMIDMLQCSDMTYVSFQIIHDYRGFSPEAVETWRDELAVAAGDLPQSTAADRIVGRIEDLIGVSVGGWDMREIFGDGSGIDDPAERRGLDGFLAIFGIANAHADETDDGDDDGVAGPREPDKIYIVARYIFGSSVNKIHTSLLYHMPVTGVPTWYSAFDSDDRTFVDGTLVAETNDPKDSPLLMRMTIGEALPPGGESKFSYFFVNMLSAHDHYRSLPRASMARYDAIPEVPCGGCDGRNSNGYVHGLISATFGQPQAAPGFLFHGLTGWEYPVESYYFGR